MKMQNILFYTEKWNYYKPLGASCKIKKFSLKNYEIKPTFFPELIFFTCV